MGVRTAIVRAIVGLCAVGTLLALPSGALAAYTHPFLSSFGSFSSVQAVAVDSSSGDVYVYDGSQTEVLKFDASGNPANFSSTGTNAITEGIGALFSGEGEIAVDNSSGPAKGDIYVAQGRSQVTIYSPAGDLIGVLDEGSGAPWGEVCGVAVDASGNVYVGLYPEHVDKFVPSANPVSDADYASSISGVNGVCNVAADSSGDTYAVTWPAGPVTRFEASQFGSFSPVGSSVDANGSTMAVDPASDEVYVDEQDRISQFGVDGEPFEQPVDSFGASEPGAINESIGIAISGYNGNVYVSNGQGAIDVYGPGVILPDVVTGQATGVQGESATVTGTVNPSGVAVSECKVEYGLSASYGQSVACAESPGEIGAGSSPVEVHADLTGLTPGSEYHYRVVAANVHGAVHGADMAFDLPGPPSVIGQAAVKIGRTEADLQAQVNPYLYATSYHVEYGTSTAYGQSTPESQPLNVIDGNYHTVTVRLAGLTPGTDYHFRFVATNSAGTTTGPDTTLTTDTAPSSSSEACANEASRQAQGSAYLPDCRAFEMVSPVDKGGTDVSYEPTAAAIDGNRFYFTSRGSFAGQPTSLAAEFTPYLSTRHADGWTTEGIGLPNASLAFGNDAYMGFTPDLSKGVRIWLEDTRFGPYDPSAQPGYNLYMRDSETRSFELLNGTESAIGGLEGFVWGTPDFGKIAISTTFPLKAGAPCSKFAKCVWEWDHGALRLASVLPDGEPVSGSPGGSPNVEAEGCDYEHAVSDDGARLFFTTESNGQLYARENGTSTTLISGSERTLPGGQSGSQSYFQTAEAAHGDRVLFTTANSLVDADTDETNDLYMYDYTKPVGHRLTLISEDRNPQAPEGAMVDGASKTAIRCGGVAADSEDMRRVYFVTENQIVPGEPEEAGPKLYLWDDTGASPQIKYIATLKQSDERDWMAPTTYIGDQGTPRQSRWSRDGRYLAFMSTASLTGFENEGQEEIYRYDAVSGSLVCVTCSSNALPAHGEVAFEQQTPFTKVINHLPYNVSDGGQVFFETTRGLDLHDSNGQSDVYEYDGKLHLISRGTGSTPANFLDATPTGSDVFFRTREQLVGWDRDGIADVYDARVDGGLPEPFSGEGSCQGEACLPAPVAPNDATPASFSFSGAGNAGPPVSSVHRCKVGRVRVRGVCRKKKPVHRKKKRRKHRRHATRRHG